MKLFAPCLTVDELKLTTKSLFNDELSTAVCSLLIATIFDLIKQSTLKIKKMKSTINQKS